MGVLAYFAWIMVRRSCALPTSPWDTMASPRHALASLARRSSEGTKPGSPSMLCRFPASLRATQDSGHTVLVRRIEDKQNVTFVTRPAGTCQIFQGGPPARICN